MGKMNELSMLVDELKKCGETLVGLSEGIGWYVQRLCRGKAACKKDCC